MKNRFKIMAIAKGDAWYSNSDDLVGQLVTEGNTLRHIGGGWHYGWVDLFDGEKRCFKSVKLRRIN